MPKFILQPSSIVHEIVDGKTINLLSKKSYDSFNPSLLGLGDIGQASKPTEAIAAVFDLEGFTNFCKQIDPNLAVPAYLSRFLPWLIDQVKKETVEKTYETGHKTWHDLPFFIKFMGDGLLILWNTNSMGPIGMRNVIVSLSNICERYKTEFKKTISRSIVDFPPSLRCGIARGTVYSVGDGSDYVGSCINMAARIQKLPGVRFAFNRRGFDLEQPNVNKWFSENIIIRSVTIRGIGNRELIGIPTKDLATMSKEDSALYRDPESTE